MKKWIGFILLFIAMTVFAQETVQVTIELQDVRVNKGTVYVAVYADETSLKKDEAMLTFRLNAHDSTLTHSIVLPPDEYVFKAYQDTNGNGKLDIGIFGAPKEPAAVSNWNGIGAPGKWKKSHVNIDAQHSKIVLCLYKLL